jgi:hypothetical protein
MQAALRQLGLHFLQGRIAEVADIEQFVVVADDQIADRGAGLPFTLFARLAPPAGVSAPPAPGIAAVRCTPGNHPFPRGGSASARLPLSSGRQRPGRGAARQCGATTPGRGSCRWSSRPSPKGRGHPRPGTGPACLAGAGLRPPSAWRRGGCNSGRPGRHPHRSAGRDRGGKGLQLPGGKGQLLQPPGHWVRGSGGNRNRRVRTTTAISSMAARTSRVRWRVGSGHGRTSPGSRGRSPGGQPGP